MEDIRNEVVEDEMTEIVEVEKKGFHPIQKAKEVIAAHPRAAKVVAGVGIGLTATLATLAVLGKRGESEDYDEDLTFIDLDDVEPLGDCGTSDDEAAE